MTKGPARSPSDLLIVRSATCPPRGRQNPPQCAFSHRFKPPWRANSLVWYARSLWNCPLKPRFNRWAGPYHIQITKPRGIMLDETTQPSLLLRVRDSSDEDAWREFAGKYRDLVAGYCRSRGLQPADCDDVQQLVWMHLAKGMRGFDHDPARGRFRDYLRRVVCSAIARHFARPDPANRALDTAMLAVTPSGDTDTDEVWGAEWVDHHYRLAMQTVRRTFDARSVAIFNQLVSGDSVAALAEAFEMTEQAVHKVKQRIRDRTAELIARQVREEDRLYQASGDPKKRAADGAGS
ncbi:MAG TPA: sigma-70 family RNA polymerase sigma factor [Phycisphaerae bacterium]|nr:sigma-70 family RNA polymerase sigma factor [Phycisphaerae bacterium]